MTVKINNSITLKIITIHNVTTNLFVLLVSIYTYCIYKQSYKLPKYQ